MQFPFLLSKIIFIKFSSSPTVKLYIPEKLFDTIIVNATHYIRKNINNEKEKLCVNEALIWLDKNFIENVEKYKE